jgi:hypothetical protein
MGTIITFYAVAFSYFFIGFHEFLHKYLLYTSLDFPTRFFEDDIHSMQCSSVQGGVLQHTLQFDQLTKSRQASPHWQPLPRPAA